MVELEFKFSHTSKTNNEVRWLLVKLIIIINNHNNKKLGLDLL